MSRIRVAIVMYGGLSYGGAHRQVIRLAGAMDKSVFELTYFWCHVNEQIGTDSVHPPLSEDNLDVLHADGVRTVEFEVKRRDLRTVLGNWEGTDFWDVFDPTSFDLIFTAKGGMPEVPFVLLPLPVVEWNIWGSVDTTPNTVLSIAQSDWVSETWLKHGGAPDRTTTIYPFVDPPLNTTDLREELGIPADSVVIGFHQRVDDFIYGEQALLAYSSVATERMRFVILGGSHLYRELDMRLGTGAIFLPPTQDFERVSAFLNTLDVYAHSGGSGETLGIVLQEAMAHSLPVVTLKVAGRPSGNADVVGDAGYAVDDLAAYESVLRDLTSDAGLRRESGALARAAAERRFSRQVCAAQVEAKLREMSATYADRTYRPRSLDDLLSRTPWSWRHRVLSLLWRIQRRFDLWAPKMGDRRWSKS